jgi:hypothetical protein
MGVAIVWLWGVSCARVEERVSLEGLTLLGRAALRLLGGC